MTEGPIAGTHLLADRYQIGDLLGRGGMAEVHAGYDARLGRNVAVKLLRPALASDPAFRTRFRQEAQAAARMSHPTIVRVYDAGEQTVPDPAGGELQLPFIVMERVEGKLLKDMLEDGPLEPAEAVRIAEGILTALEYSHRAGVVHRDIKPGNVMITQNGQVKVMDFGIARAISDSSATIAQTSAILGTAQYFSPEQARGEAVDARTDLYSTGVVLYEMLTGQAPFRAEGAVAVAYQHVSEAPVPPNTLNSAISPALSAVVLRALAKDRFERYQSAADFRADLEIALAGKVPDAAPASDDFGAALFGVNPNSSAASVAPMRRLTEDSGGDRAPRTQSRPPVAWIWGSIALFAIIVGAALYWVFTLTAPTLSGPGTAIEVPNVVGEQFNDVSQSIIDSGLQIDQVTRTDVSAPEGQIIETTPEAGTRVGPGYEITVVVSAGPPSITLPSLTYATEADAIAQIEELGLTYGSTRSTYSANVAKGVVIGIELPGSTEVVTRAVEVSPDGDSVPDVNLVISNGLVNIPDYVGEPVTTARDGLGVLQLTVKLQHDTSCSGGQVVSQSLTGDQPQKSTVTVVYCQP